MEIKERVDLTKNTSGIPDLIGVDVKLDLSQGDTNKFDPRLHKIGFSMRRDVTRISSHDVVNTAPESQLHSLFTPRAELFYTTATVFSYYKCV